LLLRQENPDDGRSAYAVLTELGLRRYRQAAPTYLAGIEEHFASALGNRELKAVAAALQRVLATLPESAR
jgi:DNA-binding MarR family transcriptional regulator